MSASDLSFASNAEPKLLDGSFNNNRTSTSFGGKAMFRGNDAINLLIGRPVQTAVAGKQPAAKQPSAKLLDNWFNGNSTCVRPKAADAARMMMTPM
jgi:hypothetical protein